MIPKKIYLISTSININLTIFSHLINDNLSYYNISYEYIGLKKHKIDDCLETLDFEAIEKDGSFVLVDLNSTCKLYKEKTNDPSFVDALNGYLSIPVFGVASQNMSLIEIHQSVEVPVFFSIEYICRTFFKLLSLENEKLKVKYSEVLSLTKFKKQSKMNELIQSIKTQLDS